MSSDQQRGKDLISMWFDPTEVDQATRQRLWRFINTEMNQILDGFYGIIQQSSSRHMIDGLDIGHLKQKQAEHWQKLFLHPVDEDYETRLKIIHARHMKIGLNEGEYVAAYFYLMTLFQKAILKHSSGPKEAFEMIASMNNIFINDLTRVLSTEVEMI